MLTLPQFTRPTHPLCELSTASFAHSALSDTRRQNVADKIRPDNRDIAKDKADRAVTHAREGLSDAVRPDKPGVGERAQRGARDTLNAGKDAVNDARKATADFIENKH